MSREIDFGEYIKAVLVKDDPAAKTQLWAIVNKDSGAILGITQWYPPWRQYCYFPKLTIALSKGCLRDIENFLVELTKKRKL